MGHIFHHLCPHCPEQCNSTSRKYLLDKAISFSRPDRSTCTSPLRQQPSGVLQIIYPLYYCLSFLPTYVAVISSIHLHASDCFLKKFCPGRFNKPCLFQYGSVELWLPYWFIRLHSNNALSEIQEEKQVALLSCLDLRGWLDPLIPKEKVSMWKHQRATHFGRCTWEWKSTVYDVKLQPALLEIRCWTG